jgi:hypothetical protein
MAAGIGYALSLASSIIPSIAQGITGGKQKREAERLRKSTTRPTYETPMSAKKMQGIAEQQATQGLVGRSILEDRLRSSTAGAVRATEEVATSPASRLAAITATYGQEMEGMEDIAMADTKARLDAANRLARAYGTMADYEDREFDINKQRPFEDTMAAASALTGAGMQNVQGALEGISRAGAAALSGLGDGEDDDMFSADGKVRKKPNKALKNVPTNISLYTPKSRNRF